MKLFDGDEGQRAIVVSFVRGLETQVDGGTVQVQARLEQGALVLEVRDHGRGLSPPSGALATCACRWRLDDDPRPARPDRRRRATPRAGTRRTTAGGLAAA